MRKFLIALAIGFPLGNAFAGSEILCEVDAVVSKVTPTVALSENSSKLGYFQSVLQLLDIKLTDGPSECLKNYAGNTSIISMKERYEAGKSYRFVYIAPPTHAWAPNRTAPIVQPKVNLQCQTEWISKELVIVSLNRSKQAPTKPGLFFDVKIQHAHDSSWKSHDDYTAANLHFEQVDSPESFYKVRYQADVEGAKLTLSLSDSGIASATVKLPTRKATYDSFCTYNEVGY